MQKKVKYLLEDCNEAVQKQKVKQTTTRTERAKIDVAPEHANADRVTLRLNIEEAPEEYRMDPLLTAPDESLFTNPHQVARSKITLEEQPQQMDQREDDVLLNPTEPRQDKPDEDYDVDFGGGGYEDEEPDAQPNLNVTGQSDDEPRNLAHGIETPAKNDVSIQSIQKGDLSPLHSASSSEPEQPKVPKKRKAKELKLDKDTLIPKNIVRTNISNSSDLVRTELNTAPPTKKQMLHRNTLNQTYIQGMSENLNKVFQRGMTDKSIVENIVISSESEDVMAHEQAKKKIR